ncbi:uncharacterized protein [Gossypium hirsutum]|uniref:Reverse transcriptase domain-containing protein n=1 Tax=Gossypium hirsutum TaxID=3635 RepID=A0A1U8KPH5_GOSHI|nr:uncharacterized protein LOC107919423 [Gossypium hirsutum]
MLKDKYDRFGLRYKPNTKQRRNEIEKRQERRRARISGEEIKWKPIIFPHISEIFVSGGITHPEQKTPMRESIEEMLEGFHINARDTAERRALLEICPYEPESELNNWTAKEITVVFRAYSELVDDGRIEIVSLEEGKEVNIGTDITTETRRNLIELLQEFKDVFAWSYRDMPGLSTDIAIKYSEWIANIVPVLKKDGKVRMCVDYRDLNKASPKDNFPLPHVDTLVDNTAGYSLFSFMDCFSGYNQIKMHPEDMRNTTFIILWGMFCYKERREICAGLEKVVLNAEKVLAQA